MNAKELWINAAHKDLDWNQRKKYITKSLESGASLIMVKEGESSEVKELGSITTLGGIDADFELVNIVSDNDIKNLGEHKIPYFVINSKDDERRVVEASKKVQSVVVEGSDWKIIPLENLIAEIKDCKIIAVSKDIAEAKLNMGILEKGADGILMKPDTLSDITKAADLLKDANKIKIALAKAEIITVKDVGMGDRACIDTCSMLSLGEGMLVGSQSGGYFLVHSESVESPYVETRPFRVNAGAVHSYILVKDKKTKYLSEVKAGDEILAVKNDGTARIVVVGRSKIESRPLLLVEAKHDAATYKILLQNAETIRLVSSEGKAISVSELQVGDEIIVHINEGGRHFGISVNEFILEK